MLTKPTVPENADHYMRSMIALHSDNFNPISDATNQISGEFIKSIYLSNKNISIVNNELRKRVYSTTGVLIPDQTNLKLYMDNAYKSSQINHATSIPNLIQTLNITVLDAVVPILCSDIITHKTYIKQAKEGIVLMDLPENNNVRKRR